MLPASVDCGLWVSACRGFASKFASFSAASPVLCSRRNGTGLATSVNRALFERLPGGNSEIGVAAAASDLLTDVKRTEQQALCR